MLRQLGLSRMMLVLPIGVTVCSAVLVLNASLAAAALLQLVFKVGLGHNLVPVPWFIPLTWRSSRCWQVTEYALFSATKELLYVPLSFEAR